MMVTIEKQLTKKHDTKKSYDKSRKKAFNKSQKLYEKNNLKHPKQILQISPPKSPNNSKNPSKTHVKSQKSYHKSGFRFHTILYLIATCCGFAIMTRRVSGIRKAQISPRVWECLRFTRENLRKTMKIQRIHLG